jgi:hypothetical protein
MLLRLPLLLAAIIPASAAEWSWTWKPAPGDKSASASITACKYGKSWAYAVEIDDGPKWARSFAVPFLARHHFTDAPPGMAGGKALPFVGSVAAVASAVGFNDSNVNWDDLKALTEAGWGVMNHSFDHRGLHWQESGKLNDREVADDAYWSQTILAAGLLGGLVYRLVFSVIDVWCQSDEPTQAAARAVPGNHLLSQFLPRRRTVPPRRGRRSLVRGSLFVARPETGHSPRHDPSTLPWPDGSRRFPTTTK